MKKIVIIGCGLAGLSAGIALLKQKKNLQVTIYYMGHHPGGRATSWVDDDGFQVDHGFHAIMHGYKNFRRLLKAAGVKEKEAFISNRKKSLFYEEDSGKLHAFKTLFSISGIKGEGIQNGFSQEENRKWSQFFLKNLKTFYFDKNLERFDDICFTRWALDNGLDPALTKKRFFRFFQDAYFNWPAEVSAYIILKNIRLLKNPELFFANGSYRELFINPLVSYFEQLGGKMVKTTKLLGFTHEQFMLKSLEFSQPDPAFHPHGDESWSSVVPVMQQVRQAEHAFDAVVIAIPPDCFRELNPGDDIFSKAFAGVNNLSTVATLSWQLWLKKPVLPPFPCPVNGLDEPMGSVIDLKHLVGSYKRDDRYGSVLQWVGQETGFESYSDDQLKEIIIAGFLKIPGAKNPREAGIVKDIFRRNTSHYERFLLTEPGINQFRPGVRTPFKNLFLAGDWIRNSFDIPNMEGAVVSGREAAQSVSLYLKSVNSKP